MVTLEGWSYIFTYVSKTFKDKIYINPIIIFVYFHAFIYIGSFYLINLFLAVTNSEFEHIERNRDKMNEKKSLFRLIQSKYDLKEKEKKEKKEKQKKLKNQNNKKSDEALKELYYKVKEEAFHISKKKIDIPKEYSTVKDIYIMAYNNPEEIYLEKLRIENEEKNLCLDIKRQRKEILKQLKEARIEMDKSKSNKKKKKNTNNKKIENKLNETKIENKNDIKNEAKSADKYRQSEIGLYIKDKSNESFDDAKSNKLNKNLNFYSLNKFYLFILKKKNFFIIIE